MKARTGLMCLMALFLVACAATSKPEQSLDERLAEMGYVKGAQIDSIREWNLNGWSYVDTKHFVMHSGARDRYLVTLKTTSLNLRSAMNISFTTTVSSLTDKDRVVVAAPGGFRETMMIDSLHKLSRAPREEA